MPPSLTTRTEVGPVDDRTEKTDPTVGIGSRRDHAPEDVEGAAGERRSGRAVAQARAALAEALFSHPPAIAAALRVLESWVHGGCIVRRALLVDLPLPGDVDTSIRAVHAEAGCQRGHRPKRLGVPSAVAIALGRLPWSGAWQLAELDRIGDGGVSDTVRHVAARWVAERNAFVEAHAGLVGHVVRRRGWAGGVPREDLIQEGHLALCRAVERFDPDRGTRFSSYAVPVVRHALAQYVRRMGFGLGAPRPAVPAAAAAASPPTNGTGRRFLTSVSLDAPLDDGGSLAERLADTERLGPDLAAALALDRERLRHALQRLPVEIEEIVILHWGLDGAAPRSVRAVAGHVGRTPAEVAATIRDALGVLRDLVTRSSDGGCSPTTRPLSAHSMGGDSRFRYAAFQGRRGLRREG
jgi:RNA polymerase sigma factor (sigma-70 family)